MKKIAITLSFMAILIFVFADVSMAGRAGKRQKYQGKRIHQGVASKQLTYRETKSLAKQQRRIQQSKKQAQSDGKITKKERVRLEIQQDKASARIYRLKHNDRTR